MILDLLRRPSASLTRAEMERLFGSGRSSSAGVSVSEEGAMNFATVFACVRVIAESGALPLQVFRGVTEARDHSVAQLFRRPNSWQTGREFWQLALAHMALRGSFYAWKNKVRGDVKELVPFAPGAVTPRQLLEVGGEVVYDVIYADGTSATLSEDEVFVLRLFDHRLGVSGISPIAYLRHAVGLGIATETHGAKLFANGARPGGIILTQQKLGKEGRQRMRDSFSEAAAGENVHKVVVMEGGDKYEQIGLSAEDSQFLQTRAFETRRIAGAFRVPPHMIGDLERSTNNNIEHQGREFVQLTLDPYLGTIEERINETIVKPSERGTVTVEFDRDRFLRGDTQARSLFNKSGILDGWLTRNEARAREGLAPLEGLDVPLIPLNMGDGTKPPAADPTKTPTEVKP